MKRNFLIIWSLVLWSAFVASGARGDSRLPFEEDTHSGTTFYRGHLSVDGHDSSFSQCNTGDTYESIDRTGGELLQVYRELAYEPGAKVYVEVSGRQDQLSEGLNKLTILKLHHAALETRGCDEDLQGFSWRSSFPRLSRPSAIITCTILQKRLAPHLKGFP
jgi:hypothetical protein